MSDLTEVRAEITEVKRALRTGNGYLGMQGEPLQQYFLSLNKKENILLAAQFRLRTEGEDDVSVNGAIGHSKPVSKATNDTGSKPSGGYRTEPVPLAPARPPPTPTDPSATPVQFDKDDLDGVLAHLKEQEGNPREAARGLRAFASLAYTRAAKIGACPDSLSQLRRLMELYPSDDSLQLAAIRGLCNVAYESTIARDQLSDEHLFSVIARAAARNENSQVANQANETVARIVTAWGDDVGGVLRALFGAVAMNDEGPKVFVAKLLAQLTQNEVITVDNVAVQLVASMEALAEDKAIAALRTFELLRQLCQPSVEQQTALITAGAIQTTSNLMGRHTSNKDVQRAGIEAFSSLVGSSWDGLTLFAQADGIPKIEAAMRAHPEDTLIQMKGLRALASGIEWPDEMRRKAKYNSRQAVELTKAAMMTHGEDAEVQLAGLEALAKYLDRNCTEEVQVNGGEGLVKAVMTRHMQVQKVQTWGKIVLDGLGLDRHWTPQNQKNGS